MIKRKFSRSLYNAYDAKAKDTLAKYLESKGHTILQDKRRLLCRYSFREKWLYIL